MLGWLVTQKIFVHYFNASCKLNVIFFRLESMTLDDVAMHLVGILSAEDVSSLSLVKKNLFDGAICSTVKRKAYGRLRSAQFKNYVTELSLCNPNAHLLSQSLQGFQSLSVLHLFYLFPNVKSSSEASFLSLERLAPNLKTLKISEMECNYSKEVLSRLKDLPVRLCKLDLSDLHFSSLTVNYGVELVEKAVLVGAKHVVCQCLNISLTQTLRNKEFSCGGKDLVCPLTLLKKEIFCETFAE